MASAEDSTVVRVDFGPVAPVMSEHHPAVVAAALRDGTDPATWLEQRRQRGRSGPRRTAAEVAAPRCGVTGQLRAVATAL